MKNFALALCAGATLLSAAHSQQPRTSSSPSRYYTDLVAARPTWLDKEIEVNIRGKSAGDALKEIVKAAGKTLEKVEVAEGLSDERLSLQIRKTRTGDALAAVGRLVGGIAYVSEENDRVTVALRKRGTSVLNTPSQIIFPGEPIPTEITQRVRRAFDQATAEAARVPRAIVNTFSVFGGSLPDKRVSLDVRDTDVRDALSSVLKQAGVDFVIEEDVPEGKKHSFTFSNIPIATALDVICKSVDIGWRNHRGDARGVVRIGKKYAGVRSLFFGDDPS